MTMKDEELHEMIKRIDEYDNEAVAVSPALKQQWEEDRAKVNEEVVVRNRSIRVKQASEILLRCHGDVDNTTRKRQSLQAELEETDRCLKIKRQELEQARKEYEQVLDEPSRWRASREATVWPASQWQR